MNILTFILYQPVFLMVSFENLTRGSVVQRQMWTDSVTVVVELCLYMDRLLVQAGQWISRKRHNVDEYLVTGLEGQIPSSSNVDGWRDGWAFSQKIVMWTDTLCKKPVQES